MEIIEGRNSFVPHELASSASHDRLSHTTYNPLSIDPQGIRIISGDSSNYLVPSMQKILISINNTGK